MSELEQLAAAGRFRASGSLGKPGALSRLFDFLLTRTHAATIDRVAPAAHASRRSRWLASALCVAGGLFLGATLTWFVTRTGADREQQSLRASDVWAPLAGTRDTGVRQIAEGLSDPVALEPLIDEARGVQSFEALYEVYGVAQASIKSKLLFANAMRDVSIWDVR